LLATSPIFIKPFGNVIKSGITLKKLRYSWILLFQNRAKAWVKHRESVDNAFILRCRGIDNAWVMPSSFGAEAWIMHG
jgi:hypothetical protein